MSEPTYAFEVTESQLHQLASGTVDWSIIATAADFAAQIDAERAAAKLVSASDVRLAFITAAAKAAETPERRKSAPTASGAS
jgi:hypothetical protein